jgi:hypothetical protein
MGLWTNRVHRTAFDDAEDLGNSPSGGPVKMWLLGVCLALMPIIYGIRCLISGHTYLPGRGSTGIYLTGTAAQSLAIAYISVGIFIHFHYFWGLHPHLFRFSQRLKMFSLLCFLGSFLYTIVLITR